MASKNFERYKRYYEAGWYNAEMLRNMVLKGKITEKEFEEITGKAYGDTE